MAGPRTSADEPPLLRRNGDSTRLRLLLGRTQLLHSDHIRHAIGLGSRGPNVLSWDLDYTIIQEAGRTGAYLPGRRILHDGSQILHPNEEPV